ncbi:hypothetical protein JOB18_023545 [Solea senegalensis]|uniref:OCIA domain-containing protein 1 n=1 Tax=Solea senegalensis TaxID=28829 RepID=A0AAV6Q9K8_SOLSE|nr:OCIA domain-containing protein 1-like [Solea senegalensis]KAG7486026.1 hypothetical protein JOB18_023545 [Solea senegalensis]KAG7486027.1 hypothetical protein JOB18_023545 [Solea senegalensis]
MSSTTPGYSEQQQQQRRGAQLPVGLDYIPTEDEKTVFKQCNQESFWYRSVPFSVVGMAVTQALVARGTLSASPRFGSLPKLAFAGLCGYVAGKMSYMKTCQEKFKRLENSPLGEVLRQRTGPPQQYSKGPQSEMSDPDSESFDPMFQSSEAPSQMSGFTRDNEYGFSQTSKADDFSAPASAQSYMEEEESQKKPNIFYEDLRLKNRENYEVTLTQKAETLLKSTPEKERERPKKNEKKNIYGDTWEE